MAKLSKEELIAIQEGRTNINAREEFEKGRQALLNPNKDKHEPEPDNTPKDQGLDKDPEPNPVGDPVGTEPEGSETAGEPDSADQLALFRKELDLVKLQNEKTQMEAEKWKLLAQQRQGQLDYDRRRGADRDDPVNDDIFQEPSVTTYRRSSEEEDFIEERIEVAKERVQAKFHKDFPGFDTADKDFVEILMAKAKDYEQELKSRQPKKYEKALNLLLREARLEALYLKEQAAYQAALTRKQSTEQKVRDQKLAMGSAGSSGSKPTGTPKEKSLADLTTEELGQLITKKAKENWHRR